MIERTPILRSPTGLLVRLGVDGELRPAAPNIYDALKRRAVDVVLPRF